MLEVGKVLKDVATFIDALKEYLSLRNKVLWEGTSIWESGSKTIPGISKYQIIQVWLYLGNSSMIMTRRGDMFYGGTPIGYEAWHATYFAELSINGDVATMNGGYLGHYVNSNHKTITSAGISKIIGIEPLIPERLQKYTGGYLKETITLLGGGIYAVSEKMFKRCCRIIFEHKKQFGYEAKQRMGLYRKHYIDVDLFRRVLQRIVCIDIFWRSQGSVCSTDSASGFKCKNVFCRNIWRRVNICSNVHIINKDAKATKWIYCNNIFICKIGRRWCHV